MAKNADIKAYKARQANFEAERTRLRQIMVEKGLDKYWVSKSDTTDPKYIENIYSYKVFKTGIKGLQKHALPFSEQQFEMFRNIPKTPFDKNYKEKHRDKSIWGAYLKGNDPSGKTIVFALTIIRNTNPELANKDFSFKLDMLINNSEWLPLVRFDSLGAAHPNLIVDGKVVDSEAKAQRVECPHIHINDEKTQVIIQDHAYSLAQEVPSRLRSLSGSNSLEYFAKSLEYFCKVCGIAPEHLISFTDPEKTL